MNDLKTELEVRRLLASKTYGCELDENGDIINNDFLDKTKFKSNAKIAWSFYKQGAFDLNDYVRSAGTKLITEKFKP